MSYPSDDVGRAVDTDQMSFPSRAEFASMLEESFRSCDLKEGAVIKGRIVGLEKDMVIIDVGLKTEGRISLKEFSGQGKNEPAELGGIVEVYLERVEDVMGEAVLSREKARREESWDRLEKKFEDNEKVEGQIFNQVKGGYTVDLLSGAIAFLPRSQVDIHPVRDVSSLMNTQMQFQIIKIDRRRGNIVVSRRSVLEESYSERRHEIVNNLEEGQVVEGVVKNTTDYGAFVDLGGIDGLLHVTDIAWRRINHPSDVLSIGQQINVQVIKVNKETLRISLGMKQLEGDPWDGIEKRYLVGERFKGTVTNITDYGAFVELESGIEGLIHISEMSWTKRNVHPVKLVSMSQEVEVIVLDVDPVKRRISLGLKQISGNPWERFAARYSSGSIIEGEIKNIAEFGLFIGLDGDMDGMVHLSDIDWKLPGSEAICEYKKGDIQKAVVLEVDVEKERISLGIKQLTEDPFASSSVDTVQKDTVVTCEVICVKDSGIDIRIVDTDLQVFIRRSDLSCERSEQNPERFAVGQKFDAMVTNFDKKLRKVSVSIKALEIAEEKKAVAQYGSVNAGASLGDILGAALSKAQNQDKGNGKETES
ncbi:MAG: 30S ribosomal protein S1 [Alphaproteobacteria bacterium]|nr:30S ribosomal protein S1 [Alphaproteobacteria bacterium]